MSDIALFFPRISVLNYTIIQWGKCEVITFKLFHITSFALKEFALAFLLLVIVTSGGRYAGAQPVPLLPPPFPENNPDKEIVAENDQSPPHIEILTTELHEGKNVFEVRIADESSLQTREVKYVHNGQLRVDGLFRDQNNVYKALIDIQHPSRIVTVTASDANGNMASDFREYEITGSQDIFSQIMDRISQTLNFFQNLFGR
jgi:hypothetical protein